MFASGKHSVCSRVCFKHFRLFRTKLVEQLTMFKHTAAFVSNTLLIHCVRFEHTSAFEKNAVRSAVNAGERTKV